MILMNTQYIEILHKNTRGMTVSLGKYQAVERYVTVRVLV
jgi:hypothetical protein